MRINVAIPEAHVKKPVLDAALEAVTRLNEDLIKSGVSPTADQLIDQGATWQPEKPGDEHFDHGGLIAERGHGDCDDWAPLKAAQLRVTGEDPGATAVVRKSGEKRWHAVVRRSDGSEDDPSLDAGMPGPGARHGVRGAWLPIMFPHRQVQVHGVNGEVGSFINTPALALRPVADRHGEIEAWQARADLPWHWQGGKGPTDIAMASLHNSPISSQAVVGAARGALRLGLSGDAHPEQINRLAAIADACEGADWDELAQLYGPEHATAAGVIVGGFFGKALRGLGKIVKKVAKPLASTALSFVPGGNLASAALQAASPMLRKNVARAKHAPPQMRPAMLVRPPPSQRQAPSSAHSPIVQHFHFGGSPQAGWQQGAPAGSAWPPR